MLGRRGRARREGVAEHCVQAGALDHVRGGREVREEEVPCASRLYAGVLVYLPRPRDGRQRIDAHAQVLVDRPGSTGEVQVDGLGHAVEEPLAVDLLATLRGVWRPSNHDAATAPEKAALPVHALSEPHGQADDQRQHAADVRGLLVMAVQPLAELFVQLLRQLWDEKLRHEKLR